MKNRSYIFFLPVIILSAWMAVQAIVPSKGPHNGTVKPANKLYIEAGKTSQYIYAYLLDSTMCTISNDGLTCMAVFDFSDKTVGNVDLLPFGKDGFRAKMIDRDYKTCTITFQRGNKTMSAEFENERLVVINNPK